MRNQRQFGAMAGVPIFVIVHAVEDDELTYVVPVDRIVLVAPTMVGDYLHSTLSVEYPDGSTREIVVRGDPAGVWVHIDDAIDERLNMVASSHDH